MIRKLLHKVRSCNYRKTVPKQNVKIPQFDQMLEITCTLFSFHLNWHTAEADTAPKSDPTQRPPEVAKATDTNESPLEAAGKTEEAKKEVPVEAKEKDKSKLDAVTIQW